jgi:hypothetical protein
MSASHSLTTITSILIREHVISAVGSLWSIPVIATFCYEKEGGAKTGE